MEAEVSERRSDLRTMLASVVKGVKESEQRREDKKREELVVSLLQSTPVSTQRRSLSSANSSNYQSPFVPHPPPTNSVKPLGCLAYPRSPPSSGTLPPPLLLPSLAPPGRGADSSAASPLANIQSRWILPMNTLDHPRTQFQPLLLAMRDPIAGNVKNRILSELLSRSRPEISIRKLMKRMEVLRPTTLQNTTLILHSLLRQRYQVFVALSPNQISESRPTQNHAEPTLFVI